MADGRKLVQLQGFAKIEYGERAVKFILLDREGRLINENSSPLLFTYETIFDKQVFTTTIENQDVQFVSVLLDVNEEQFSTLKDLTHSVGNWRSTELQTLTAEMADKGATRPPSPKNLMVNSLREWHMENDNLVSVSGVVNPIQH
jgi:hypothetical protein